MGEFAGAAGSVAHLADSYATIATQMERSYLRGPPLDYFPD
jgi:hypothetical protein